MKSSTEVNFLNKEASYQEKPIYLITEADTETIIYCRVQEYSSKYFWVTTQQILNSYPMSEFRF